MIKINNFTEEYLNFINKSYILESDNNLTEDAIKLKEHFKYVIEYLILHDALEIKK